MDSAGGFCRSYLPRADLCGYGDCGGLSVGKTGDACGWGQAHEQNLTPRVELAAKLAHASG